MTKDIVVHEQVKFESQIILSVISKLQITLYIMNRLKMNNK
jgi:hypothetical protein